MNSQSGRNHGTNRDEYRQYQNYKTVIQKNCQYRQRVKHQRNKMAEFLISQGITRCFEKFNELQDYHSEKPCRNKISQNQRKC